MCSLQTKRQYCTDAITIRRGAAHACGCGLLRGLLRGARARSYEGRNVGWAACWPDFFSVGWTTWP
eukprot:4903093-Prymnesium_polylepis.1